MLKSSSSGTDLLKSKKSLLSSNVFHKGKIAIVLITFTFILMLTFFGFAAKEKVISIENQWHNYSSKIAFSFRTLGGIQENFGYGGFIHNFKSYVFSKDATLVPKIEKNLAETRRLINEYPLHGVFEDLEDKKYVSDLIQVVDQYAINVVLVKQLIAKGVSSNEIHRQVEVNDAPALKAIKHLLNHAIDNDESAMREARERLDDALSYINFILFLVPMVFLSGIYMFFVMQKITKINDSLEESHKFLSDLFEAAPDAMMIVNKKGMICEASKHAEKLFSLADDSLIGKSVEELIPHRFRTQHEDKRVNSFMTSENRELMSRVELYALDKDKNEIPVDISLSFTKRNNEKYAIVIIRDITEQKNAEERIQHLAQYDQLTKLPNRLLFNDRLQHSISRAQRNNRKIGLLFLDLDGFKAVNDSLGHQAGDELLQIIALRLSNIFRTDDTVARFGGDEFTIILEELEYSDHAVVVAEKVLSAINETIYLSSREVKVGASIGISIYPDNGTDVNELIKNADAAMYESKKQGKNCYKFYTIKED